MGRSGSTHDELQAVLVTNRVEPAAAHAVVGIDVPIVGASDQAVAVDDVL